MKSVLLGGLKVWLVNDGGSPLSAPGGRAKFYKAGTSTPETVYSDIDLTDGSAFGPEVRTDKLGYLPAIWLKTDRLYKVVVEQRIQEDPETWEVLWEVDNVGYIDPHEIENSGEEPVTVDNISSLKDLDHTEHHYAIVLGYYSPGDFGSPAFFRFDEDSMDTADDGAYVRPNDVSSSTAGRWLQMFEGDVLDVRKFGAIPNMSEDSDISGKVINAVNYSQDNSTRTRPLTVGFVATGVYAFSGNFDFSQYNFIDLTDNSEIQVPWYFGNGVVLKNLVNNNRFTLSGSTVCEATGEMLSGTVAMSVQGGGYIKVDPAWWGGRVCTLEDCIVECHSVTDNTKSFTRCKIDSNRMLDGTITLNNCGFKQEWFVADYDYSRLTLSNTKYSVHDCFSANDYIAIKNALGDAIYGDLGEQYVDAEIMPGCELANCRGILTVKNGTGTVDISNASVSIKGLTSSISLNCVNSWLTVDAHQEIVGSTVVESAQAVNNLVILRGSIEGYGLNVAGTTLLDSVRIDAPVTCSSPVVRLCDISSVVNVNTVSNALGGTFSCNKFVGSGKIAVLANGNTGAIALNMSLTGNYSDHDFFDDSSFNGVMHITTGKIQYDGNYGGCPGNEARISQNIPYSSVLGTDISANDPRILPTQDDNTCILVNDNRHNVGDSSSVAKKQFWWSLKLNFSISADDNNIWICHYLKFYRKIEIRFENLFEIYSMNSGMSHVSVPVVLSGNRYFGPDNQSTGVVKQFAYQLASGTEYGDSNVSERASRLSMILADSTSNSFAGVQHCDIHVG